MSDPTLIGPSAEPRQSRGPARGSERMAAVGSGESSPRASSARDQRSGPLLRTTLGDVLRRTRREQRRTLADVARAAKVSMPYLSEVERGRKEASSEVLGAICEALGIELSDLLTEAGRLADRRAPVVRLDLARAEAIGRRAAPPARGPGDAQCLLAA
jgi:transcriptional regulator with XRE-family HTH domain